MISGIQTLRGIAACLVVYYHAHGLLIKRHEQLGLTSEFWLSEQGITKLGAIGVDIFFVISGFIIFHSVWGKEIGAGEFLTRRGIRIYPIYWVATVGILVVSYLPGSSASFSIQQVITSFLLYPSLLNGGYNPILEVGWTLYYEVFFYLCLALLIWQPRERILIQLTGAFAALVILGLVFPVDIGIVNVATNPRLLEFVAGGWLAFAFHTKRVQWDKALRLLSLAIIAASFFAFVFIDAWREDYSPLVTRGPFAISLVALVLFDPLSQKLLSARALQFLGDASYSIYLFHMFPFIIISGLWKRGILVPPTSPFITWGLLLLIGVLAGLVAHVVCERPLLMYLQRRFPTRRSRQRAQA